MEAGKHDAVSNSASVYEKDGKLLVAMEFRVGADNDMLIKRFVLFKADGTANEDDYNLIREFSGWDGIDPYWIQENAGAEWPVSVVTAWEAGWKDPSKQFLNIKWVNTVSGGGGGMPASADRAAIMSRFGSKLRAMAGPQPVGNPRHTPIKQTAPVAPPARPPARPVAPVAPVRPAAPVGVKHTSTSCWEALVAGRPGESNEVLTGLWFTIIGEQDQGTMTSDDWARVADAVKRSSVATAKDEEPLPF